MKELMIEAKIECLDQVLAFIDEQLEGEDCPIKTQMQIDVSVEEIFVNIASYAYPEGEGTAIIRSGFTDDPLTFTITFIDEGIPYDPLAKEDPDVTLAAEKRQIGGLGIFMVKKSMDEMFYEYKEGKNILTLRKKLAS